MVRRDRPEQGEVCKSPHVEGVASHGGPESCAGACEGAGEALTGARAGWAVRVDRSLRRGGGVGARSHGRDALHGRGHADRRAAAPSPRAARRRGRVAVRDLRRRRRRHRPRRRASPPPRARPPRHDGRRAPGAAVRRHGAGGGRQRRRLPGEAALGALDQRRLLRARPGRARLPRRAQRARARAAGAPRARRPVAGLPPHRSQFARFAT